MNDSIERVADILIRQHYVVCLSGAGMSVESGIRPFRGPGGLWTEFGEPPLDDYRRFVSDPVGYWRNLLQPQGYYLELYKTLEEAVPHEGYVALAELERRGVIKHVITQNIDGLHNKAGSKHVAEIHGNYTLCRCVECGTRCERSQVDVSTLPPRCPVCAGVMKSDVVVFGEPIPEDVGRECSDQVDLADCMLLVGTSAYVYPAAGFPRHVSAQGGILIEMGPHATEITELCDISVRGTAAELLPQLCDAIAVRVKQPMQPDVTAE